MVAAVSESPNGNSNNVGGKPYSSTSVQGKNLDANVRKPRAKHVASRYLSPSPSSSASTATTTTSDTTSLSSSSSSGSSVARRFGSPLPAIKRSQSADRRRPGYNANAGGELSAAAKLLVSLAKGSVSTSTRSLSVSFQGECFSLPISKEKATNNGGITRKATPERKRVVTARDLSESSKLLDRHRWPGSSRQEISGEYVGPSIKSFNWVDTGVMDNNMSNGCGSGNLDSFLGQIVSEDSRRVSFDTKLNLDLCREDSTHEVGVARKMDTRFLNESFVTLASELTASDTDSVSSGSTSGGCSEISRSKSLPHGIAVSARFWQETNSRLRRLQDPGSPLSMSPGSRVSSVSKSGQSKRFSSEGSLSAPRSFPSSTRGATRPASPGKTWASVITSPLRGMLSPSRIRPGSSSNAVANSPSILSFSVDIRRGKVGEDRIDDAHRLRLLYNCHLLWRFVNARADATFIVQTQNVEKILWGTWITISELRHSVAIKKMNLLLLRRRLTLASILKEQINYLEDWSQLELDHASSLSGANEALKASTLRLPVIENAVVNMQHLKTVMGSAVDVMQGMSSSICSLSSKVEEMNSQVTELADVISKECFSLDHCKQLLSALTAMRVNDCSLRTQLLQLNRCMNEKMETVGSETECYAIADTMAYCKSDVYTVNCGMAYGQAAMLLSLGTKGYRALQPNSSTKLYLPKVSRSSGAVIDMWIKAKELDANTEYYIELQAKGVGKPKEEIEKDMQRPKYFRAQEAIEYGITDKAINLRDSAIEKRNYDEMLGQSKAMKRGTGTGPLAAPSGFR